MYCSGIIVSNVFLGMISKQLVDTDSSPFNHVCGRYFVQNMSIAPVLITLSISDGTRHSKNWLSRTRFMCKNSIRFPIPINTDHLSIFVLNTFYFEYSDRTIEVLSRFNSVFCHVTLPIYTYREGIQCVRMTWVSGEICLSRCCSQHEFFVTARRNYSTSYQVQVTCI